MCSVNDDVEVTVKYMEETQNVNLAESKCNKCRKGVPKVVLRKKDVYCKQCFIEATEHKFKSILGKHKLIHKNDRVLINHTVGHPSTALLNFIRNGLNLNTAKKLRCTPIFIFIENNYEYKINLEERKVVLEKIADQVVSNNFPVYFISLQNYIKNPNLAEQLTTDFTKVSLSNNDHEDLKKNMKQGLSASHQTDLLHIHERNLLIGAAKELKCKYVFTPEISIDIASSLLTNIALGRGSQLPLDTGLCDTRDADVTIARPLRLFDMKELAFYNVFNKLEPVTLNSGGSNPYDNIQNLMGKFVKDLQVDYPATVSTIVRIGDKLGILNSSEASETCLLCKAQKDNVTSKLSSADSTLYSHWISTHSSIPDNGSSEEVYRTGPNFGFTYCYSCSNIKKMLN